MTVVATPNDTKAIVPTATGVNLNTDDPANGVACKDTACGTANLLG